jgi:hypothetical protein
VAIAIPLTLAVVFPMMDIADIDLQRISLGALIIALALMVDDAMTTIDAMSRRLALGDPRPSAATYAYRTLSFADADRHPGHHRRLRAHRLRRRAPRASTPFRSSRWSASR